MKGQMDFDELNYGEDDVIRRFNRKIQVDKCFEDEMKAFDFLWSYLLMGLGSDKICIGDRIIDLRQPHQEAPYYQNLLLALLKINVAVIYQCSDPNSPKEKEFLSLFLLHVMINYPFRLIIEPYMADTNQTPEAYMEQRRSGYGKTMELHRRYQELTGKTRKGDFLDFLQDTNSLTRQEKIDHIEYFHLWHCYNMKDAYIVTLQAQFNDMNILGSRVRPDMLIWIPSLPEFKFIVECDGYNFHKDREPFVKDRKRLRAFQDRGYHYYSFSGLEIHHNSFRASWDLLNSLEKKRKELVRLCGSS